MSHQYIKRHIYKEQTGPIVQPRSVSMFTPAISSKHIPSTLGTREGSNDHLNWASPFGKKAA